MQTKSLLILFALLSGALCYYLPGVAPRDYREGDKVELTVNVLRSSHIAMPFDYYNPQFNFCPMDNPKPVRSNLGTELRGDRVFESPYQLFMRQNTSCQVLCTASLDKYNVNTLIEKIQDEYYHSWFVDSLPAGRPARIYGEEYYATGIFLGLKDEMAEAQPILFNHHSIVVEYADTLFYGLDPIYRVVGVIVYGYSKKYSLNGHGEPDCGQAEIPSLTLEHDLPVDVTYTYDVHWVNSATYWGLRWDNYLRIYDPQIHWFSIINSIVVAFFVAVMFAIILLRIKKDVKVDESHEKLMNKNQSDEEVAWKMLFGDVFRAPTHTLLLSVFVGNGVQIMFAFAATLIVGVMGFLSPSLNGSLVIVALTSYVCFAFAAGYVSARLYKMFEGEEQIKCIILTATLVPGFFSVILLTINFLLMGEGSSAAVPLITLAKLFGMWILIACPLCLLGSFLGFRKITHPAKVNPIPRPIPPQPFFRRGGFAIAIAGLLPFGSIFMGLFFTLFSIWLDRMYYLFGYLFLTFAVSLFIGAGITVCLCYFHLCSEDYRWWWRAFFTSGSCGVHVFVYCIIFYFLRLDMHGFASALIYFGWSVIMASLFFLMMGAVGFLAALWFVRKIYQ